MSPSRRRRAPAYLILLCLGLAAIVYREATQPDPDPAPAMTAAPRRAAGDPREPHFAMAPLSAYAEVVARPLFSPTRRPAATAATAAGPSNFLVTGIVISPTGRVALVAHGMPAHVDRVVEGQSLDGWTVEAILPDHIVLARDGTEIALKPEATPGPERPIRSLAAPFARPSQSPIATAPSRPRHEDYRNP